MTRMLPSRRRILKAGGVSLALPLLERAFDPPFARAADAPPKRLIIFFTPNGTIYDAWVPKGTATSFTLSPILAPLEMWKNKLVVVDGVKAEAAMGSHGPGDDHQRGIGTLLTGAPLLPGNFRGGCCAPAGMASSISIDQHVANAIGKSNKFKSLELGVRNYGDGPLRYTSYAGSNQPLPAENNPANVYKRLFADFSAPAQSDAALERLKAERKSVLDATAEAYQEASASLSKADKEKIDAHFTTIRDLETRLSSGGSASTACKPTAPASVDFNANATYPTTGKLQMDLLVSALACDLTRVGTVQWTNSAGYVNMTWLGINRAHHDLSHDADGNMESRNALIKINAWYSEQLAYLMQKLADVPEGNGTMLDNTLILWCNELGKGNDHSHPRMPFVLAGGAGGALRTGRFLQFANQPFHNDLLVSVGNLMGVPMTTFGTARFCKGALPGVA